MSAFVRLSVSRQNGVRTGRTRTGDYIPVRLSGRRCPGLVVFLVALAITNHRLNACFSRHAPPAEKMVFGAPRRNFRKRCDVGLPKTLGHRGSAHPPVGIPPRKDPERRCAGGCRATGQPEAHSPCGPCRAPARLPGGDAPVPPATTPHGDRPPGSSLAPHPLGRLPCGPTSLPPPSTCCRSIRPAQSGQMDLPPMRARTCCPTCTMSIASFRL